ncbi:hypothetical protein TKK_0005409 [Trichogramma kaykai]
MSSPRDGDENKTPEFSDSILAVMEGVRRALTGSMNAPMNSTTEGNVIAPPERETEDASSAQNLVSAPTEALPIALSDNNDGSTQPRGEEDCLDTLREEALQSLRRARCVAAAELRMLRSHGEDSVEQSESVEDMYRRQGARPKILSDQRLTFAIDLPKQQERDETMPCLQIDLSDEDVELNCAASSKSNEPVVINTTPLRQPKTVEQSPTPPLSEVTPTLRLIVDDSQKSRRHPLVSERTDPRWLPVPVNTLNRGRENWDEDGEAASAMVDKTPESQDRQDKRQLEQPVRPSRRQWTVDDYEPLVLRPRPRSPGLLGPQDLYRRQPTETQGLRSKSSSRLAPTHAPVTAPRSALPIKFRGVQFGGLTPIVTDPTLDPPPFACFNCWGEGHNKSWCREPRRRFCSNCGRRGVDLIDCPRCKVAHNDYMTQRYGEGWNATESRKRASPSRQDESQVAKRTAARSTTTTPHHSMINSSENTTSRNAGASNHDDTGLIARILEETKNLEPDVRDAVLRRFFGIPPRDPRQ